MNVLGLASMAKSVPVVPVLLSRDATHGAPDIEVLAESLQAVFGRNFRGRRLAAGLTQKQVAEAAGMHRPEVTAIESGAGNVTLKTMERLARVVGCRVEVLLTPIEG